MTLNCAGGDEEGLGDFAVAKALACELGDTALAGCQRVEPRENDPARSRTGRAELGLGLVGEPSGSGPVGNVDCFVEELPSFGASIAPAQHRADIYTVNVDGSGLFRVTNTPDVEEFNAHWGTHPLTP